MKNQLMDKVINQIIEDIKSKDHTAIVELLQFLSEEKLRNFLADDGV